MRKRLRPFVLILVLFGALGCWPGAVWSQAPVGPPTAPTPQFAGQARQLRKPWGEARATRHWPRTRSYDLQHVKMELSFDWEKKEVAGVSTLTLAPINDGLRRLSVDAAEMTIESVASNGRALEFATSGEQLSITLDRAYAANEKLEVAIRYRTSPRKGLYFMGPDAGYPARPRQLWSQGESEDNRYWIPLYDFPNDKATSEMIATVPADMIAISNGRLVEVRNASAAAKAKTFHWREAVPHVTYLISLIVGRFDRHSEMLDGLPLDYYVPPGTDPATVARSFDQTAAMIRFYNQWTDIPYPYEKYAQTTVEQGLFGGMENISATTLYTDTLHDEAAAPNWTSEGLVAHELAHQWWGDLLTCHDWPHLWLNESFATFFDDLWHEHRYGRDEYDYRRWQNMRDYFKEEREEYRRPIVTLDYVSQDDFFDEHTYPKGAVVLDMLRTVLGDPLFQKAIRHYGKKFSRQVVETEDFRKAIAEATGQELGWFFDQWLYRAGHPEFSVRAEWEVEAKQLHLIVEQKQKLHEMTPLFRMPVDVEFTTAQGPQTFRIEVAHARDDFYFPLPERPARVRFDPGQRLLKTLEFAKSREELMDLLRGDPNVIGRIWAAEQLARRGNDLVAVAALREALLKDPFYGVRREVARVLGETKLPAAREALLAGLRDPDPRVREDVAEALGEFQRDAEAASALERVIAQELKTYVVGAALKALGKTRSETAFEQLRGALTRPSHRDIIRRGALEGFAELGDARGVRLALEWSRYGRPPRAREAAIEALGKLGRGNEEVLQHLLGLLNDPYLWARRSAAKALGEFGDKRAVPALEAVAANELERRIQREAEKALDKIHHAQAASPPR